MSAPLNAVHCKVHAKSPPVVSRAGFALRRETAPSPTRCKKEFAARLFAVLLIRWFVFLAIELASDLRKALMQTHSGKPRTRRPAEVLFSGAQTGVC